MKHYTSPEYISWKLVWETGHTRQSPRVLCLLYLTLGMFSACAGVPVHRDERAEQAIRARAAATSIPPLPNGVTELKFSEFFVMPIGSRGLELTDKLRRLDGQRVRILGYMVRQEESPAGSFLLSPFPVQVHDHDNGLADDLPPSTLHVTSPSHREQAIPYTPQLMLLTGTLNVGNRTELDGRISPARLTLDPVSNRARPKAGPIAKGAERLVSRQPQPTKDILMSVTSKHSHQPSTR